MMTPDEILARTNHVIDRQISTPDGREFVAMLLEDNHWLADPFSADANSTNYNVGRIQVANAIYKMVEERQPEQTAMMLKEWRDRRDQLEGDSDDD